MVAMELQKKRELLGEFSQAWTARLGVASLLARSDAHAGNLH